MASEFCTKGMLRFERLRLGGRRAMVRFSCNPVYDPLRRKHTQDLVGEFYPLGGPREKYQWVGTVPGKYHFREVADQILFGAEPNNQLSKVHTATPKIYVNGRVINPTIGQDVARLTSPRPVLSSSLRGIGDDWGLLNNPLGRSRAKRAGRHHANRLRRLMEGRKIELAKQFFKYVEQCEVELPGSSDDMNSRVEQFVSEILKGVDMSGVCATRTTSSVPGDAMKDINYRAFVRDAAALSKQYGRCAVAYSEGKRIALGTDRKDVRARIPAEYRNSPILIQEIPERVIKFRRPFRVRRERKNGLMP